jgi:hypothetical protein
LDDKITEAENPLSRSFLTVRAQALGSRVDPVTAAEIVTHLAPRAAHIRTSMAAGVRYLVDRTVSLFSDPRNVERLLELDQEAPTDLFRERLREGLSDRPEFEQLGLPSPVLERVAFYLAKENFGPVVEPETGPFMQMFKETWDEGSDEAIRKGHNRSLEASDGPNVRRDLLATFDWTVEAASAEGAILPDCVALAYEGSQPPLPLMFVGQDMRAVVMPLSTEKLLVGQRPDSQAVDTSTFNEDAAACSHRFFLARDAPEVADLSRHIAERPTNYVQAAVEDAVSEVMPPKAGETTEVAETAVADTSSGPTEFGYQLTFSHCDEETAHKIADVVKGVINGLARGLPMGRLDGITFAADYTTALQEVGRGRADLPPITTTASEGAVGIAYTVIVVRDERVKGRIVLDGAIGDHLIGDDRDAADWALHVLVHQLVLVAMIEWMERALPGITLSPVENAFQGFLYRAIDAAIRGYVAAKISGVFGDPHEIGGGFRDSLISALDKMKTDVEAERLAYRRHADVDSLLDVAMPAASHVLYFAAALLGNSVANERSHLDEEGRLAAALERSHLTHWLTDFHRDLERFYDWLGAWRSFDEFLSFTRHVERLLWSCGMFAWESPAGLRVEIPLATDAAALMAEMTSS